MRMMKDYALLFHGGDRVAFYHQPLRPVEPQLTGEVAEWGSLIDQDNVEFVEIVRLDLDIFVEHDACDVSLIARKQVRKSKC